MQVKNFPLCVHLILIRKNEILLLERKNTKLFDNYWCLPTGSVENGETPRQAVIRETFEEIGISVNPSLSTIVSVKQPDYYDKSSIWQDISFFFYENYANDTNTYNKEPDKHSRLSFFSLDSLPKNIIPIVNYGIKQHIQNINYGEFIIP